MEPRNSSWFCFRRGLQLVDVLLDVAGHLVESFGEFADFRGAAHFHAFVKFRAAHRARGLHQAANGARDAEGERDIRGPARQTSPPPQSSSACAVSSFTPASRRAFVEAALRDHGPAQAPESCCRCRSSPIGRRFCPGTGAVKCIVSVARKSCGSSLTCFTSGEVEVTSCPGTNSLVDRIRDDVAVHVHDENGAVAHARVLNALHAGGRWKPPRRTSRQIGRPPAAARTSPARADCLCPGANGSLRKLSP